MVFQTLDSLFKFRFIFLHKHHFGARIGFVADVYFQVLFLETAIQKIWISIKNIFAFVLVWTHPPVMGGYSLFCLFFFFFFQGLVALRCAGEGDIFGIETILLHSKHLSICLSEELILFFKIGFPSNS